MALKGVASFVGRDLPKPCVIVIAYTGHTIFSENYPPTFIVVSKDDSIVSVSLVDRRVKNLKYVGVDVAYHTKLPHYRQTGSRHELCLTNRFAFQRSGANLWRLLLKWLTGFQRSAISYVVG